MERAISQRRYIGVDLDGTLAHDAGLPYVGELLPIGRPIPAMHMRVLRWLDEGKAVRIITARVSPDQPRERVLRATGAIEAWLLEHVGQVLPVQAHKCHLMLELWDDRARPVEHNTGRIPCYRSPACNERDYQEERTTK